MATQTKDQALAASNAALAALTSAANARFIAEADAVILEREAQGEKYVKLALIPHSNFTDLVEYYRSYGYLVAPPQLKDWQAGQPAQLFGPYWEAYWNKTPIYYDVMPTHIIIAWE